MIAARFARIKHAIFLTLALASCVGYVSANTIPSNTSAIQNLKKSSGNLQQVVTAGTIRTTRADFADLKIIEKTTDFSSHQETRISSPDGLLAFQTFDVTDDRKALFIRFENSDSFHNKYLDTVVVLQTLR
jgi:hypothetical protein